MFSKYLSVFHSGSFDHWDIDIRIISSSPVQRRCLKPTGTMDISYATFIVEAYFMYSLLSTGRVKMPYAFLSINIIISHNNLRWMWHAQHKHRRQLLYIFQLISFVVRNAKNIQSLWFYNNKDVIQYFSTFLCYGNVHVPVKLCVEMT